MRWSPDRARFALIAILAVACSPAPSPSALASAAPSGSAAGSAPASQPDGSVELAHPGRPFDAATILTAMQTSPRPDGVPDAVETEAIAAAVASAIWTWDGAPWDAMAISGTCASDTCTLEVAGSRSGGEGEDVWTFAIAPGTDDVSVEAAELRAMPAEVVADLDALARSLSTSEDIGPMLLSTARWLPPPDTDRYHLSYRSGGEEGSCAGEIVLDVRAERLVDESYTAC